MPLGTTKTLTEGGRGPRTRATARFALVVVERLQTVSSKPAGGPATPQRRRPHARDAFYGAVTGRTGDGHRDPLTSLDDPPKIARSCGCGRPIAGNRAFLPGRDQQAVHDRIARDGAAPGALSNGSTPPTRPRCRTTATTNGRGGRSIGAEATVVDAAYTPAPDSAQARLSRDRQRVTVGHDRRRRQSCPHAHRQDTNDSPGSDRWSRRVVTRTSEKVPPACTPGASRVDATLGRCPWPRPGQPAARTQSSQCGPTAC